MKKILLFAVFVFCVCLGAVAQDNMFTVYFDIDDASHLKATETYYNSETYTPESKPLEIKNGLNTFTVENYHSIQLVALDGFFITSVERKSDGNKEYVSNKTSCQIFVSESNADQTYIVTTKPESESRTAKVTIKADQPEKINLMRTSINGYIQMTGETMEFAYDPADELPIMISTRNTSDKIYKVTVSEGTVVEQYGTWRVTPVDGAVIDIQVAFPDKDVVYTLESNTGNFDFLTVRGGSPMTDIDVSSGKFTVKAGVEVTYSFNTQDYKINSFTINGEPCSQLWGYTFTATDDATHAFNVTKYDPYEVKVVCNMPDKITVHKGSTYDPAVEAVDGVVTLTLKQPNDYSMSIKVASDYYIKSVVSDPAADDINVMPGTFSYQPKQACTLTVEVDEIRYDRKTAVFVDDAANIQYWSATGALGESIFPDPKTGYNVYEVSLANSPVRLSSGTSNGSAVFYYNGAPAQRESDWSPYSIKYTGNDIIHVFTNGVPDTASLTFDLGDGVIAEAKHNKIVPVTDFVASTTLFVGDEVCVTVGNDNYEIKINDQTPEKDENGNYTFNIAADTKVSIEKTSGISEIGADEAVKNDVIYNLQGIRVSRENLPAGIYISNGKKIYIR